MEEIQMQLKQNPHNNLLLMQEMDLPEQIQQDMNYTVPSGHIKELDAAWT